MRRMRFGLLRHAATEWNREHRIQGHRDSPLTPEGERNALSWGDQFIRHDFKRIIHSDLGRSRRTAELVNRRLNLPMAADPRLREQDWGDWTGLTHADVKRDHADELKALSLTGWDFTPPGGESRRDVARRAREALTEFAHGPETRILIVAHEGVLKFLLGDLAGWRFAPGEPSPWLKEPGLYWVAVGADGFTWERFATHMLEYEPTKGL